MSSLDSIFETKSYGIVELFVMLTSSTKFIAMETLFTNSSTV